MKRFAFALSLLLASACWQPVKGDTALDLLGVEKSINDLAEAARKAGDQIALAFAEQALRVIKEWKEANGELVDKVFDGLDEESKKIFSEMNRMATRLEVGEAVLFKDIQESISNIGGAISVVPFSNRETQMTFYWPSVVLPSGEKSIDINVVGFKLADAAPRATLEGEELEIRKKGDNKISIVLDRSSLPFDKNAAGSAVVSLEYSAGLFRWYSPMTWFADDTKSRDITVRLLPRVPGSVTVIPQVANESWETMTTGPDVVGGRGMDNSFPVTVSVIPALREAGWVIDKDAQASARFDDNGGDGNGGSSCNGYVPGSFTDTSFVFMITHGHVTGSFGRKSDAYQNCRVWTHLKRKVVSTSEGTAIELELDWLQDSLVDLPENAIGRRITMKMYDGIASEISSAADIPYGLFEVLEVENRSINFRPRPQRDF